MYKVKKGLAIASLLLISVLVSNTIHAQYSTDELSSIVKKINLYNNSLQVEWTKQNMPQGDLLVATQEDLDRIRLILSNKYKNSDPRVELYRQVLKHYEEN